MPKEIPYTTGFPFPSTQFEIIQLPIMVNHYGNDYSWKVLFWSAPTFADEMISWLDDVEFKALIDYGGILFQTYDDALLFYLRFSC